MRKLILLLLLCPILLQAQHIPTLKDAVSNKDTIRILTKQVNALDARLTTCENASADSSIVFRKKEETFEEEKGRRFWKGVGQGIKWTLIVEALALAARELLK